MKKRSVILLALALTLSFAACGQAKAPSSSVMPESAPASSGTAEPASAEPALSEAPAPAGPVFTIPTDDVEVRVAALKGPTAIGMVKLMEEADGEDLSNYKFTMAGAPDEIVGKIIQGEFDIAAVPTNLAATLYNKTEGKVKLAALNTMGILYVVENGDTIQSIADLAGKTVYSTGKGSVPEFAFNYILAQNDILGEVTVEYKSEHTELANLLAAGQADLAVLPQPFVTTVTMQNPDIRVALDLTKEWDAVSGGAGGLTMGCIVIQQQFIEEHPEAVKAFLENYRASVEFVTDPANLDAAAELVVARGIIPKAPIAKAAIPECSIVFKTGEEMKTIASGFYQVLFDADPQSVGGKLPDENLYFLG
ncbi:ABC transporter substrate-binding protein [Anaerotruncus rubiinfantis]|uniref:ABC transporter substrate-binding protein n=1 Tax=Anaerotruncus rubiinfantis TaxID=1720200 RepID=UPI0008373A49|nr:ABC transporter substrate-binding protein [Anaerotruncus rubiinfantis]